MQSFVGASAALVEINTVQSSIVGALAEDDWGILGSAFRKAPVALVVVWVVVAVVATVAVHSVQQRKLLWEHAPIESAFPADGAPRGRSSRASAGPRSPRRMLL